MQSANSGNSGQNIRLSGERNPRAIRKETITDALDISGEDELDQVIN